MKKIFLILFGMFVITGSLQTQDLIVTHSGDSIHCKITKTTKDYVYFTFTYHEEIRNTLLPTSQITTQKKNYFSVSELPAHYTLKDIFPRIRFVIDGGWQYRTAKLADGVDAALQEHYKKMKSGFHYDLQGAYFFIESMGIEAMFSQQSFKNNLGYGSLTDEEGNLIGAGECDEKTAFNYIGANYLFRLFDSKKKNNWLFSVGLGYMGYNDRWFLGNVEHLRLTANTFGFYTAIGYDIWVSKNFGIGFKISLMDGTFRNYKQTLNGITTNKTMPEKTAEGLGTVKLSIGLRVN